ncbi:MAG: DUF1501 domain-containing protein [Planctomycetales bacterium]|nr:DUF1501 domain-containing protein [Planctomycetales bacterium]MBN8624627.1 DUF1501 domain-containing protein [Planctomycetota bacterium]
MNRFTRRRWLHAGAFGLGSLGLADLLRLQAATPKSHAATSAGHKSPPADACIVLFLNGGPSHLDMWDMKPDAPEGVRGEFKSISTSVPGYSVGEHMPKLARQMHRFSVVRSMHHRVNNAHALAVYTALTGHDRGDANMIVGQASSDYPTPGAALAKLRPAAADVVPSVVLPYLTKEGAKGPPQPGFFGGFLGRGYDPLFVLNDPNAPEFDVPELALPGEMTGERLAARRNLLTGVGRRELPGTATSGLGDDGRAYDQFQQRAFDLLTSSAARQALRLTQEKDADRERYGRNIYGQSVLLARRLVEAGTRCVTISWAPDANATWDTHAGNFTKLKDTLLPQLDAACSSLVDDLVERGMWERTIVAVFGDFGRTPTVNKNAGRDHWNYCYSLMLGGGGFRGGFQYGASDKTGAFPARDPLVPGDIIATIYRQLGVDPTQMVYDQLARPHRLVADGSPVTELLA